MLKKPKLMGIFSSLKRFDMHFNPRPWIINQKEISAETCKDDKKDLVDFHIDIAQKVDALLEKLEQENNESEIWDMSKPLEGDDLTPEKILLKNKENIVNR
ncbi:MAG TPA: hypothetical protein ENN45_05155 [Bacteroidetes bacterium]|mgnify:CR=1 FL=1|nr:hypothetical protein [Bacteroidota bacterium]